MIYFKQLQGLTVGKKGKNFGLIVDYFGVTKHLAEALEIYTDKDKDMLKNFLDVFRDINKEIPVLEARYNRIVNLFKESELNAIDDF